LEINYFIFRYQRTSKDAQKLAEELIKQSVKDDTLFERCKTDAVLLVLDRSEASFLHLNSENSSSKLQVFFCQDPVSPLLNQWTYEAMVHELIGLNNNRVALENVVADGQKNLVLSAQHDEFYAKVYHSSYLQ
jgi:vacuolar protein sorting-associated protein 45